MNNINKIIDDIFKSILKDLNSIDVQTYRKLVKGEQFACFSIDGQYIGDSFGAVGEINIKYSNCGKFKKGIKREVLLEKDKFILKIERMLKNK